MLINSLGIASITVQETTGRGIVDHTASAVTKKDCRIPRAFSDQPVCQDPAPRDIQITKTNTKPLSVVEIESMYRQ
jgi:predicted regulator of amino acid metabolism with ACT domain